MDELEPVAAIPYTVGIELGDILGIQDIGQIVLPR